jgi:ankyrin repeat protein
MDLNILNPHLTPEVLSQIQDSIKNNDLEAIKLSFNDLISKCTIVDKIIDNYEFLLEAINAGVLEIFTFLLEFNPDVNIYSRDGRLLHIAYNHFKTKSPCQHYFKIIDTLLKKGATINFVDNKNRSLISYACEDGSVTLLRLFLTTKPSFDIIDSFDNHYCSPLIYAISSGSFEAVKLLIDHNADPKRINEHGYSCLHFAVQSGDIRTIDLILKVGGGSLTNAQTNFGGIYITIIYMICIFLYI